MLVFLLLPPPQYSYDLENRTSNKWVCCHEIFRENNQAKRAIFFKMPFIQFLWTIFITEAPKTVIDLCKKLLENEEGKGRYQMLMKDIQTSEVKFKFQILPAQAKNELCLPHFDSKKKVSHRSG